MESSQKPRVRYDIENDIEIQTVEAPPAAP
jgi:hypothetical protein